jgi:hypothetical protein
VATQLFHLEGPSLEQLKAQSAAMYGPRALIVSAELVTVGGISGVFARKHYEIVVEVPTPEEPDTAPPRPRGRRSAGGEPAGIKALLEKAELDEVRLSSTSVSATAGASGAAGATPSVPSDPGVSTTSGLFAALMDNLASTTDPAAAGQPVSAPTRTSVPGAAGGTPVPAPTPTLVPAPVPRAVPVPSAPVDPSVPQLTLGVTDPAELPQVTGQVMGVPQRLPEVLSVPGDLVVIVGTPATSWEVTASMAGALGAGSPAAAVLAGPESWSAPNAQRVRDRLEANAARAAGVDGGHPVFLALTSEDPLTDIRMLLVLRADQVWLAVDAGRKEADTAAWVGALRRSMEHADLAPAGLAVVGSAGTATPETVLALGLPVGWSDGRAAVGLRARRHSGTGRRRARPAGIE